jgi:hypothetical protein
MGGKESKNLGDSVPNPAIIEKEDKMWTNHLI